MPDISVNKLMALFIAVLLTTVLSGCIESVNDDIGDTSTVHGKFSTSYSEQRTAERLAREVIDFQESSFGDAKFIDGFSVINYAGDQLYLATFKQAGSGHPTSWAETLQKTPYYRKNWPIYTAATGTALGETVFDSSSSMPNSGIAESTVAVKVEYKSDEDAYWVYLAIPKGMMTVSIDSDIQSLFRRNRS